MKELSISTLNRIANQYETVFKFLAETGPEKILHKPVSGKWSIHENLAHLARYQEVFLDRLLAILKGDSPAFERYSADQDPEFPTWTSLTTDELISKFKITRRKMFNFLIELKNEEVEKKGRHPRFGEMNIAWWTEFFLLHESHHLFTIYALLCESIVKQEHARG